MYSGGTKMTTITQQILANNTVQLAAHNSLIDTILDSLSLQFNGGNKIYSRTNEDLQSETDILQYIEIQLQLSNSISSRTPLTSYWRPLIALRMSKLKMAETGAIISNIAFDGSNDAELRKLIVAMTGSYNEVTAAVFKHFLWQVKRKLIGKDVTWHMMPILWGKTGSGKSVALNRLFSPLKGFVNTGFSLDKLGDDRYYKQLAEHFILFLDEMPKIEKASIEAMKQIISADELTGRLLYGHGSKLYKQNCTFIGTSNEAPSQLIKDHTSMRRFHYIKSADKMDHETINNINMLSIWKSIDEMQSKAYILDVFDQLTVSQEEIRQKDSLEMFIVETNLKKNNNCMLKAQDLFDMYTKYCSTNGYTRPLAKQGFNRQLIERFEFDRVEGLTGVAARYPHFYAEIEGSKLNKLIDKGIK